jgi:hypothetical protein
MQLLGGALAVGAVLLLHPDARQLAGRVAAAGAAAPAPSQSSPERTPAS